MMINRNPKLWERYIKGAKHEKLPDVSYAIVEQDAITALAVRQLGLIIENVRKVTQP
jgi:hypothetical protein